ncbi:MAG: hypothetical protein FJZ98_07980 [Chloroflexi bacterium]|nr:hypothetical protein [Chloroflexota bacterium]
MPRTLKEILPPNDYAGRLGLGLVLLVISQWMTQFDGAVFMVLRWVLLIGSLANYIIVLVLYVEQRKVKQEKGKE